MISTSVWSWQAFSVAQSFEEACWHPEITPSGHFHSTRVMARLGLTWIWISTTTRRPSWQYGHTRLTGIFMVVSGPAGGLFRTAWCWTALVGGYLANSACRTGERNHSDWLSICRCSIHDFIHLELLILIFPDIFYLRIGYIDVNCVKKCCLIIPMVFISEV